mgnify:CR=1 FL=1
MNTEIQHSVNKDIQAILSGPHPISPGFDRFLIAAHGINAASTKLLASWFSNTSLVKAISGKCGHVSNKLQKQSNGRSTIRIYADDDTYHSLDIQLPADIDYIASIGRYFGYRDCCAQYRSAVCEKVVSELPPLENSCYGHCPQCRVDLQPYDRKLVIDEINSKRVCPTTYPNDQSDVWIRYRLYDAVFKGEMSFALLSENKFIQT